MFTFRSKQSVSTAFFLVFLQLALYGQAQQEGWYDELVKKVGLYSQDSLLLSDYLSKDLENARVNNEPHTLLLGLTFLLQDEYSQAKLWQMQSWVSEGDSILSCCSPQLTQHDPDSSVYWSYLDVKAIFKYDNGQYIDAIRLYKNLVNQTAVESVEDSIYVNAWCSYLGSSYLLTGNPDMAIHYYNKYVELIPEGLTIYYGDDYPIFYRILGHAYLAGCWKDKAKSQSSGDQYFKQSLDEYQRALASISQLKQPQSFTNAITSTYYGLVDLFQDFGYYDSASYYLTQISKVSAADPLIRSNISILKGKTSYEAGQLDSAMARFKESLELVNAQNGEGHWSSYDIKLEMAKVLNGQGQRTVAFNLLDEALSQLSSGSTKDVQKYSVDNFLYIKEAIQVLQLKAELLAESGNTEEKTLALEIFDLAIQLSLKQRQQYNREDLRQQRMAEHRNLIEKAIKVCFELHEKEASAIWYDKVFSLIEYGKSQLFLESNQEDYALSTANIPSKTIGELKQLKSDLLSASDEIRQPGVQSTDAIFGKLKLLEEKYDSMIAELKKKHPEYYQLKFPDNQTSLTEFQKRISNNQNVFSYFTGDSLIYLLAFDSNKSSMFAISNRNQLGDDIKYVLDKTRKYVPMSGQDMKQFTTKLSTLYERLVKPAVDLIDDDESIYILPDGHLSYLNFDLLLTEELSGSEAFNVMPFMLKKWPISYQYSAQVLISGLNKVGASPSHKYLGFAPTYETDDSKGLMVKSNLDSGQQWLAERAFDKLVYNEKEVQEAASIFGGRSFLADLATEQNFRQFASDAHILHLSMHAYADEKKIDDSGLVFYNFQPSGDIDVSDGFLSISDLHAMKLGAELVVLSACETGYGYLERGEGVASIGRAFRNAGCPTVAVSLWKANDQATAQIMGNFFNDLSKGEMKDRALQQAKLNYLASADKNTSHPYFWSAFIINGDPAPLSFSQKTNYWYYILETILILVLLVFVVNRRKR